MEVLLYWLKKKLRKLRISASLDCLPRVSGLFLRIQRPKCPIVTHRGTTATVENGAETPAGKGEEHKHGQRKKRRPSMEKSSRHFPSSVDHQQQTYSLLRFSLPPLLFCRCPSPQRRRTPLQRPRSIQTLNVVARGADTKAPRQEEANNKQIVNQGHLPKSQSALDLAIDGASREEPSEEEDRTAEVEEDNTDESTKTARAAMATIESELCGMLGRLQFHVNAIVGFARLCTGDLFEVSIKHGHQRWRTRGKTQPDKSQKWDQQPASCTFNALPSVPVHVKVLEVNFLRSRCLSERQFDPVKFAAAQPQLVTMNLNEAGSIKLRLVVTWLPLLSTKPLPIPVLLQSNNNHNNGYTATKGVESNGKGNGKMLRQHQSQNGHAWQPSKSSAAINGGLLPPKVPPKRQQSLGGGFPQTTSTDQQQSATVESVDSPVKVCLRDKKRQRNERLQAGVSVAASLGSSGAAEASRADKQRWRCSSTTLLDEVYRDLAKSIPTIDDLSALQPKSGSVGGGSLGPAHRLATENGGDASSSSVSEGRAKSTKRIFSFVKRAERAAEGGQRNGGRDDWRKSVSLGQIAVMAKEEEEGGINRQQRQEEAEELEEPDQFREERERDVHDIGKPVGQTQQQLQHYSNGGSGRRARLSNLKKGRSSEGSASAMPQTQPIANGSTPPSPLNGSAVSSSSSRATSMDSSCVAKCQELEAALAMVDALLAKIDQLRGLLTKLRSAEFTELVNFEATMLNWEACLKLNRSAILCQLDALFVSQQQTAADGGVRRGQPSQLQLRQRIAGSGGNRSSLFLAASQQHSPSTTSYETDDSNRGPLNGNGTAGQHNNILDHISENDSGIDSLRQYHSPYSSQNGTTGSAASADLLKTKDRRKSIGAVLDIVHQSNRVNGSGHHRHRVTATGSAEMDKCLGLHLDRAEQALQTICDVQDSPFEYSLTRMLCQLEGVETIALESLLGFVQDMLAQCQPNPQNVLLQLGLQFQLQQCWLSACERLDAFLFAPLAQLRDQLRPLCEPIVRSRYPKLVDKVLDSLVTLLSEGHIGGSTNGTTEEAISLFQFVALFRGKQFPAFIENLSHEAWITVNLQQGQPGPVRDVMDRLRNVPVVPPLESLRHIGLAMATQPPNVVAPIEKYLRKAAPGLALDLAACFVCLLEHDQEMSRVGACRALATLRQENSLRCLDFLSRTDPSAQVRAEAHKTATQIRRFVRAMQQEVTKI